MTSAERKRLLEMIRDAHTRAMRDLRGSGNAFDSAIAGMRKTLVDIEHANNAQMRAIDRVLEAHELARRLLEDENLTH